MEKIPEQIAEWRKMNMSEEEILTSLKTKGLSDEDANQALRGEIASSEVTSHVTPSVFSNKLFKFFLTIYAILIALTAVANGSGFGGLVIIGTAMTFLLPLAIIVSAIAILRAWKAKHKLDTPETSANFLHSILIGVVGVVILFNIPYFTFFVLEVILGL